MNGRDSDKAWFSQCVEENLDALYGAALHLTRQRQDAEDLVAETVTRAWQAVGSLEDRNRFRPWIFRILRNRYISDCRYRAARPRESAFDETLDGDCDPDVTTWLADQPDAFLKWWANPEKAFFNALLGEGIRAAIENLPAAFRDVVLLINVAGMRYDEAAAVLGVPTGTVRSRMKRGRTLLQKSLWEQARDAGLLTASQGIRP